MEVSETWSEYQKKRVRVLHVGTRPGQFKSIGRAVGCAEDGDRIEVAGGKYVESIVVSKQIELVGCDGETPEVGYRGTVIAFVGTASAIVVGFDIAQHDKTRDHPVITVSDGSPRIADCRLPSILVTGTSSPVLVNNTISGALQGSGVRIKGKAGGVFKRNRIHSHEEYCIEVDTTGSVTFEDNRIWCPEPAEPKPHIRTVRKDRGKGVILVSARKSGASCKPVFRGNYISDAGEMCVLHSAPFCPGASSSRTTIWIANDGCGVFEQNDIIGGVTGIKMSPGAAPLISDNTISKQDRYGVLVETDNEGATLQKNRFIDCGTSAVQLEGSITVTHNHIGGDITGNGISIGCEAAPTITHNTIDGVSKVGVKVHTMGSGTVFKNEIKRCEGPCILLEGGATPVIEANIVTDGRMQGIVAVNGAAGIIKRNDIIGTAAAGIAVLKAADPIVTGNRVSACVEGVLVSSSGRGGFRENIIEECGVAVIVSHGSAPSFVRNKLINGEGNGFIVREQGMGTYIGNTVEGCKKTGMVVETGGDPDVQENTFVGNGEFGVKVTTDALGTFVQNKLSSNALANVHVTRGANPVLRGNTVTSTGHGDGVWVDECGMGRFEKNKIHEVKNGFCVRGEGTRPHITTNTIVACSKVGVLVDEWAVGCIERNTVRDSKETGLVVRGGACPVLRDNVIRERVHSVVIEGEGTAPVVQRNSVSGCGGPAVVIRMMAHPEVSHNTFIGNLADGILVEDKGSGSIVDNELRGNACGVSLKSGAHPVLSRNTITGSTVAGVEVRCGAAGVVCENTISENATGIFSKGQGASTIFERNILEANTYAVRCSKPNGVQAKQCDVTLTDNSIFASAVVNVLIENGGHLTLVENDISSAPVGVLCKSGAFGMLRNNKIHDHPEVNVRVVQDANPIFDENTISGSKVGIEVSDDGKGMFVCNVMKANDMQVHVLRKGNPTVKGCDMSGSTGSGLVVRQRGEGVYLNNNLNGNTLHGMEIEMESNPTVKGNTFNDNVLHGIFLHENGLGAIQENTITGNGRSGIYISTGARPTISGNTIQANMWGIRLERDGYGHICDNKIHGNKESGVDVEEGGDPFLNENAIYHELIGVSMKEDAKACLRNNEVRECHIGVNVASGSCPEMEENTFSKNQVACKVHKRGRGVIGANTFVGNVISVEVLSGGCPTVHRNTFDGNNEQCVGVAVQGGGTFRSNTFVRLQHGIFASATCDKPAVVNDNKFRDNTTGVTVTTGSSINIVNNTFSCNTQAGIFCRDNGRPVCHSNTFNKEQIGVHVTEASGEFTDSHFDDNEQGLVISGKGCAPVVSGCRFLNNDQGLVSESHSAPSIECCYFDSNERFGLGILSYAVPQVFECFFVSHAEAAVEVAQGAGGLVAECVAVRNRVGASILSHATTRFHRNHFAQSAAAAVSSTHYGKGEVEENVFSDNAVDIEVGVSETRVSGNHLCSPLTVAAKDSTRALFEENIIAGKVVVTSNADPVFKDNIITGQGVTVEADGLGSFEGNTFFQPSEKTEAILFLRGGRPRAVHNTFMQCARAVLTMAGGQGHFSKNTFTGGKVGVEVREGGDPYIGAGNVFDGQERAVVVTGNNAKGNFERCEISAALICGVLVEREASPTFLSADVFDSKTGVHIVKRARGLYKECNIFDNSLNGVHIEADCKPHLVKCKLSSALETGALHKDVGSAGVYEDNKIKHLFSPVIQKRACPRDRWELRKNNATVIKKTVQELEKKVSSRISLAAEWCATVSHLFGKWNVPLVIPTTPTGAAPSPRPKRARPSPSPGRKSVVSVVDNSPPHKRSTSLHRRKSTGSMSRRSSVVDLKKTNSARLETKLDTSEDLEARKKRIIEELKAPVEVKQSTVLRKASIIAPKVPESSPPTRRSSRASQRRRQSFSSSPSRRQSLRRSSSIPSRKSSRVSSLRRKSRKPPVLSPQAEALASLGDPNFAVCVLSPASKHMLETPRALELMPRRSSGNLHKKLNMYADEMPSPSGTAPVKKPKKELQIIPPFEWGDSQNILSSQYSPSQSAGRTLAAVQPKHMPGKSPRQVQIPIIQEPQSRPDSGMSGGFVLSPQARSISPSPTLPSIISPTTKTVTPCGVLVSGMQSPFELPSQTPELRAPANTPLLNTIVMLPAGAALITSPSEMSLAHTDAETESCGSTAQEMGSEYGSEQLNTFVFGATEGDASETSTPLQKVDTAPHQVEVQLNNTLRQQEEATSEEETTGQEEVAGARPRENEVSQACRNRSPKVEAVSHPECEDTVQHVCGQDEKTVPQPVRGQETQQVVQTHEEQRPTENRNPESVPRAVQGKTMPQRLKTPPALAQQDKQAASAKSREPSRHAAHSVKRSPLVKPVSPPSDKKATAHVRHVQVQSTDDVPPSNTKQSRPAVREHVATGPRATAREEHPVSVVAVETPPTPAVAPVAEGPVKLGAEPAVSVAPATNLGGAQPATPVQHEEGEMFFVSPPTQVDTASPLPQSIPGSDVLSPDSESSFVPTPMQLLLKRQKPKEAEEQHEPESQFQLQPQLEPQLQPQLRPRLPDVVGTEAVVDTEDSVQHIDEDQQPQRPTEQKGMTFEVTPATPQTQGDDEAAVSISPLTTPQTQMGELLMPCGSKRSLISAQSLPLTVSELSYQGTPACDLPLPDTANDDRDLQPLGGFDMEHIEEVADYELPLMLRENEEYVEPKEDEGAASQLVAVPLAVGETPWGTHLETLVMLKKQSGEEVRDCLLPRLGPPTRHPHRRNTPNPPLRSSSSAATTHKKNWGETAPARGAGFLSQWAGSSESAASPDPAFPPPIKPPKPLYLTYTPKKPQARPWASSTQISLRRPFSAKN